MEQRVSLITLGVENLERSREFYERLGWRRSMAQAEGVVFFQAGGKALAGTASPPVTVTITKVAQGRRS